VAPGEDDMSERTWCESCQAEQPYRRTRHGSWHRFFCMVCDTEVNPHVKRACQDSLDRVGNWMGLMEEEHDTHAG